MKAPFHKHSYDARISLPEPSSRGHQSMRMGVVKGTLAASCLLGLVATHCGAQVTLAWNPSTSTNVTGYSLWWGTNSGNYLFNQVYPGTQTNVTISNLAVSTVFFFAVQSVASDGTVSVFSNEQGYTNGPPPASAPLASTQPATNITFCGATVSASVTPQGADTMVYFAYGASTNYDSASALSDVGSGTNAMVATSSLTGLLPGTTYHFQANASNSVGTASGGDLTFTTPAAAPMAVTQPAAAMSSSSATFNASVTPQGTDTLASFLYGTNTNYGNTTAVSDVGCGTNALAVSSGVTGLCPATTYHFTALASNIFGATFGGDMVFTTTPASPLATTQPATSVNSNGAMLNALVTPQGAATTVYFAFGTNTSYGSTNVLCNVGSGTAALPVSSGATGLLPGTVYHVQALASNSMGAVCAGDVTFTTAGSSTPASTVINSNALGVPPVLNLTLSNGMANLTISGTVGATFTIMGTTNDMSMAAWSAMTNVTVSNTAPVAQDSTTAAPEDMLGVAFVPGTVALPLGPVNAAAFQFFNVVMPGDYIILADQVLPDKGYTPRLMLINMPGIVADDACYINETANFIHYTRTNSGLQLITSGSTIRQIAVSLADWLNVDWTSASEFTYSNGLCQILATVIETEPPSSDPVAGQNPPTNPIVIDF